ncbi:hypothetical protein [Glutamicibacter ardleyensis]|uniref:Phage tail protein n=1 Tax=Glutamicibacter ardleyensis TaxID=225894 RepID=A0ABQ2DV33_9MICC|nr:hypothetical protein [Glutamicibacter ardleyensis]GGJ74373.1 hypothetical protein GCM10007173_36630 [Glutamicibacter ardleyensis]
MAHDLSLIIGGMELNNPSHRNGYFEVDDIDGWWKAPSRKTRDESRPNADGDFDSVDHFESRFVTIKGAFAAKSPGDRWAGADILSSLLSGGSEIMTVRADGQAQWARVKLVDNSDMDWTAYKLLEYSIQVKAVDPRKFGGAEVFTATAGGSSVGVFQRGTYPATPILTISGTMPGGYRITKGGKTVSVTAPLTASQIHTLDLSTGILRIDGAVATGGLNDYQWNTIAPGLAQNVALAPLTTGTGALAIEVTDTYM